MFEWLFNKNSPKAIAKKAVRRAKKLLRSRHAPSVDVKVHYVWWYGAVEIDTKHCVVWIMLSGPDSERIPERLMIRDEKSQRRARERLSAEDCQWLENSLTLLRASFALVGGNGKRQRSVLNQPSA
jgi:hypothetical protein